ncbi:hypothetical protein MM5_224 [Morganella phage vB_Mm5]
MYSNRSSFGRTSALVRLLVTFVFIITFLLFIGSLYLAYSGFVYIDQYGLKQLLTVIWEGAPNVQ